MFQTLSIARAQQQLPQLVRKLSKQGVTITVDGKPSAVLLSIDEYESWKETQEIINDPKLMADVRESEDDIKAGRVYDWEDVKKEFGWDTAMGLNVSDTINKKSKKAA